jgi:GNAT superfamily N-acetyltransferase
VDGRVSAHPILLPVVFVVFTTISMFILHSTNTPTLTFFDGASVPQFELGAWWLAYHNDDAVAFAGVIPSTHARNGGYFSRVGVLRRHWGRGLQLRLMRAIEARGRRIG